jgi:glycosyltransferase involved in cell wall biosynthesis
MIGRMTEVKGGHILLQALPRIASKLSKPLLVTMAGDGPCRAEWEAEARKIQSKHANLEFRFPGWLTGADREGAYLDADLLLFPSVWPEPFGMVGLEAGQYCVPSVGFGVGGVPDWLKDGVNGYLASGDPPSAAGYAAAVLRALAQGEESYLRLREGARRAAGAATIEGHHEDLLRVFRQTIQRHSQVGRTCNA